MQEKDMSLEELEKAHLLSALNREFVEQSEKCGCFYCRRIFDSKLIEEYIDGNETAMCPFCGIDSVLPDTAEFPLSEKLLEKMHRHWF